MNDYIDLEVSGVSTMPGGEYGDVEISGAGKIEGNLRCDSLDISGAGKVQGDVVCAGTVDCSGAAKILGNLEAENLDSSGSFTVEGNCIVHDDTDTSGAARILGSLETGSIDSSGSLVVEGYCAVHGTLDCSGAVDFKSALRAETVDASGSFNAGGEVSAETFACEGVLHIDGLLNAEEISLKLVSDSVIRDVGGAEIHVHSKRAHRLFGFGPKGMLHTNTIEGDLLDLEYTEADVVRGREIHIGPGCRIRRAEYGDLLTVDPNASVAEKAEI